MEDRILELTRTEPHFAYEAYEFVCDAVTYTVKQLDRTAASSDSAPVDRHVSGGELVQGACDLAVHEFGMMAPIVFKQWGIRKTDDIGTMVFLLIGAGKLSKSERDDPADFCELFDLHQALTDRFAITLNETPRRSER